MFIWNRGGSEGTSLLCTAPWQEGQWDFGFFCCAPSERMRGNNLKINLGRFCLGTRKKFSLKEFSGIGISCPESWSHHLQCSRGVWMWPLGTWFFGGMMVVVRWQWNWMILKVSSNFDFMKHEQLNCCPFSSHKSNLTKHCNYISDCSLKAYEVLSKFMGFDKRWSWNTLFKRLKKFPDEIN